MPTRYYYILVYIVFSSFQPVCKRIAYPATVCLASCSREKHGCKAIGRSGLTGFVLFHALSNCPNLTYLSLSYRNYYQERNIFIFAVPVDPQIIPSRYTAIAFLQRMISPVLHIDIFFLVQFTDCGQRYFAAPQGFSEILHPARRDAGEVYLNESSSTLFSRRRTLNDDGFKRDVFETGRCYLLFTQVLEYTQTG